MTYTIRTARKTITTVETLGDALAYAETHPELINHAITWGNKGSEQNLTEWRLMTRNNIDRLTTRGIDTTALLSNDGTR